ncbi:hypothetical protein ACWDRR_33255 [Kitasatospora sp. NPDC003701]
MCDLPCAGDATGGAHRLGATKSGTEALHVGPVSALAGVLVTRQVDNGPPTAQPVIISGGADGQVRAWRPGHPPMPTPVWERGCAVVSVAAAHTAKGLLVVAAWQDGAVRIQPLTAQGRAVEPALGSPVVAVAVLPDGQVVLTLDDGVVSVAVHTAGQARACDGSGAAWFGADLVVSRSAVGLAGGQEQAHVVAVRGAAVLRAGRAPGAVPQSREHPDE